MSEYNSLLSLNRKTCPVYIRMTTKFKHTVTSLSFRICVGFNALFSGSFDETGFVADAYNAFLPGLMEYLTEHQPAVPQPPSTTLYEGVYNASGLIANIQLLKGMLILTIKSAGRQPAYLAYRRPYEMQVEC